MKRVAVFVAAILIVVAAALIQAPNMSAQEAGDHYTEEDGHPLKLISYLLAPIGFVFDWGVMRPLHYLSSSTPLKPVMTGNPDNYLDKPEVPANVPPLNVPAPGAVAGLSSGSGGGLDNPEAVSPSATVKRTYKTAPPPPPEVYPPRPSVPAGAQAGNQPVMR